MSSRSRSRPRSGPRDGGGRRKVIGARAGLQGPTRPGDTLPEILRTLMRAALNNHAGAEAMRQNALQQHEQAKEMFRIAGLIVRAAERRVHEATAHADACESHAENLRRFIQLHIRVPERNTSTSTNPAAAGPKPPATPPPEYVRHG